MSPLTSKTNAAIRSLAAADDVGSDIFPDDPIGRRPSTI